MFIWFAIAILTILALLFVLLPLARQQAESLDPIEYDKAMYKARQAEINRDLELGRISKSAADAALAEEGRRLIAQASSENSRQQAAPVIWRFVVALTFLAVPALAMGGYLAFGSPDIGDFRLAQRKQANPADQSISELVSRVEAHLGKNPDDAKGWAVLAPVYARMGRFVEATQAWGRVRELSPDMPGIDAILGEMIVLSSDGVVTERARSLFQQAIEKEPGAPKARFYLAMAKGQEGEHKAAVSLWDALIASGDSQSPWMEVALQFRNQSARAAGLPLTAEPGPGSEQIEDAAQMSREDRQAMIHSMVDGLAEKLKNDPSNKEGWRRLVRAYQVLQDRQKLNEAVAEAIKAHQEDLTFVNEMNLALEQDKKDQALPQSQGNGLQ